MQIPYEAVRVCILSAIPFCACAAANAQKTGYIHVKSEPGVTIYLDGVRKGVTKAEPDGLVLVKVSVGRHVLRAVKEDHEPQETTIVLGEGVFVHTLEPFEPKRDTRQPGLARGRGYPWEAKGFVELKGHGKAVRSVAFSAGGRQLATASEDKTVRIWDVSTGRTLKSIDGEKTRPYAVAYSPGGRHLAIGNGNQTIDVWDLRRLRKLGLFWRHDFPIVSVAFSPDGRYLASGSQDRTARLWDLRTGRRLWTFDELNNTVESVVFSPDGRTVAIGLGSPHYTGGGTRRSTVVLVDVGTGRKLRTFTARDGVVHDVAFSHDGRLIAAGCGFASWRKSGGMSHRGQGVALWEVESGAPLGAIEGHKRWIYAVAFSLDDRHVATGSMDFTAALWNVANGRRAAVFEGHENTVLSAAFSPDGRYLATGSGDATARIWKLAFYLRPEPADEGGPSPLEDPAVQAEGAPPGVQGREGEGEGVLVQTLKSFVAKLEAKDGRGFPWEAKGYIELRHDPEARHKTVTSVAFSPGGRRLATAGGDKTVRIWDVSTGRMLKSIDGSKTRPRAVAYSPGGRYLAIGNGNQTIDVWDLRRPRKLGLFWRQDSTVVSVAFSPDGRYLASGSQDDTARVWDMERGRRVRKFDEPKNTVESVAFSPDGRHLATGYGWPDYKGGGTKDCTAALWDVASGRKVRQFTCRRGVIYDVAFSHDGSLLAAACEFGYWTQKTTLTHRGQGVAIWRVETGWKLGEIEGHKGTIRSVAFTADDHYVATASDDHTAALWNVANGRRAAVLEGHEGEVHSVDLSPGGAYLATGSADGTARVWRIDRFLSSAGDDGAPSALEDPGDRIAGAVAGEKAGADEKITAEDVRVENEIEQVRRLVELAEAGKRSEIAAEHVAGLMTRTWRGKRLSRWCYHAIARISHRPGNYLAVYMKTAGWLHYSRAAPGEPTRISAPVGDKKGPELPDDLEAVSDEAWRTCITAVAAQIGVDDRDTRYLASQCLEKMWAPEHLVLPPMIATLLDSRAPAHARKTAAKVIGRYGHSREEVGPLVRTLSSDAEAPVRAECAVALGMLSYAYHPYRAYYGEPVHPNPERAVEALVRALRDPEPEVRRKAAEGLRGMRREAASAVPELFRLAENGVDLRARRSALSALASVASPGDVRRVAEFLGDPDVKVRYCAAGVLGSLANNIRRRSPAKLSEAARGAVGPLTKALGAEPDIAWIAAQSLGGFGRHAAPAVPALRRVLRTPGDVRVRDRAIHALGRIGGAARGAVGDIIRCAPEEKCHVSIASALRDIGRGGPEVDRVLLELAGSKSAMVRRGAATALGKVGSDSQTVTDALIRLLDDPSEYVQEGAEKAVLEFDERTGGAAGPTDGVF